LIFELEQEKKEILFKQKGLEERLSQAAGWKQQIE
jgi:hypothetical protein